MVAYGTLAFYNHAAAVHEDAARRHSTQLQLPSMKAIKKRSVFLILETLKFKTALQSIIARSKLLEREAALFKQCIGSNKAISPESLALVIIHDMLFTPKGIALPADHTVRLGIERHATRLKAEKEREKIRRGVKTDRELAGRPDAHEDLDQTTSSVQVETAEADEVVGNVRWMRVNELKWSREEAEAWLEKNGWSRVKRNKVSSATSHVFARDKHLEDVFAFPLSQLKLTKFEPYRDGRLIAQDKASCMPARVLFGDGSHVSDFCSALDATAAPGNKTTHLSALVHPYGGKVVAFERDAKRFETLQKMCDLAGCENVTPIHGDFLAQNPLSENLRKASLILVDPSCSGSGIPSRLDEKPADADRLGALSRFQATVLRFALNLPSAERVVYSTCSVHKEENEAVVCDVLGRPDIFGKWRVATRQEALPTWERRGLVDACGGVQEMADGMIRCDPRQDGTNGFFVCLLVRANTV